MRTYERGVEVETLVCGTGSVAAGIVASKFIHANMFSVETQGGNLVISFEGAFKKVKLKGAAVKTFTGLYNII